MPLLQADPRLQRLQVVVPPGALWPGVQDVETLTWPLGDARLGYRQLRTQLRQLAPDVIFIPTARWLDCGRIPIVVMVRNMEPLTVPFGGNSLLEGAKNLVRAYTARWACQRANRVIAVSQHVHDFLTRQWRISSHKIGLVYHGTEPPPGCNTTVKPPALDGHALERFIFTAGSIRPARGLEDVIRAMAVVSTRDPALTLVIGGQSDPGTEFYLQRMQGLADNLGVAARIMWTGQLQPLEMAWCFDHCAVFVTTSRAEACPNTALEAMSHGCQVVSTRQPPMPEFFMTAALYYQPEDASALAWQIGSALAATPEQRQARQQAAQVRARSFVWSDTAQQTIEQLALTLAADQQPHSG